MGIDARRGDPRHEVLRSEELWEQAQALQSDRGIRMRVAAANVAGAVLVAFQSTLIGVPAKDNGTRFMQHNMVSGAVVIMYLIVSIPLATLVSQRRSDRTFRWIGEHRDPTGDEIAEVLDYPWVQAREIFVWWLGGAALFVILNFGFGNSTAWTLRQGLGVVLGGLTSSGLSFLMLERFNRPTYALALGGDPETGRGRLGLQRRLLFTWVLGAAVPVVVIVTAPAGMTAARRAELAVPLAVVGVVALAAGFLLTVIAARSVTEPIAALRVSQARVGEGTLNLKVPVDDGGEIGQLQAGFNQMVTALRDRDRLHDLFGRHVGIEVARQALNDGVRLGGELRDASVLFVDVIGSTALAQSLPPHEVVALLNEFFAAVVRSAAAEGGWVNKFEGDAALCVFGPPGDDHDHAAQALRAGLRLRDELSWLSDRRQRFDAGIGISSGPVVAGNVGAEERYEYTVIGDPVNEAARLAEVAKNDPSRLVASGATVTRADARAQVHWHRTGEQILRGRTVATGVYTPTARLTAIAPEAPSVATP